MPIESVGRKDPALAARMCGESPELDSEWDYFVGRRALRVGKEQRPPGAPLPEAAEFPRLESWLNTGMVVRRAHIDGAYEAWWDEHPELDPRIERQVEPEFVAPRPTRTHAAGRVVPRRPASEPEPVTERGPKVRALRPLRSLETQEA